MLRIVTDTASDITTAQANELGIDLIPLVTAFDDVVCPMNDEADFDRFYEKLRSSKNLPLTSRPSPASYLEIFQQAKQAGDEVVVLTLSSGLSSTLESAQIAKEMSGYDKISIIDTEQAVMSQRILVEYAVKLRDGGANAAEVVKGVLDLRSRVTVVGIIGSLVYLRKGGRIPPALALVGDALKIKPVITVSDKVIISIGKARGYKAGVGMAHKKIMEDGIDHEYPVCFGYTSDRALGEKFMDEISEKFDIKQAKLCQVNGIIGTHLGTDSVGLAYIRKK